MRMSDSVPGLVETSTNLGAVSAAKGTFSAGFLVRSAVNSARDDVQDMAASVFALAGIDAVRKDAFTGWKPNPDSPLLEPHAVGLSRPAGATTPRSSPCTPVSKRASSGPRTRDWT